jgi:aspartate aminotransferase
VGWAVYPTVADAKVHRNLNINYFASIPPYNQIAARVALESPESEPAIRKMTDAFQRRRDQVVGGLNSIEGIRCQNPQGAFYVFPNVSGVIEKLGVQKEFDSLPEETRLHSSPATLFQLFLLYRYHVATMDRRSFGALDSEGQHFLRLSIATGAADLAQAVERIQIASNDEVGFHAFARSGVRLVLE